MATERVTASALRSLRTAPSIREERNGSTKVGSCRSAMASMARAVASRVVSEPGSL